MKQISSFLPSVCFNRVGEATQEQGGIVLHDSGSERGRFICDTCGSECRSAAGLKSHITAMHQARSAYPLSYCMRFLGIVYSVD